MSPDLSHEELLSMIDALAHEAPVEAKDIADELFDLVHQHRDQRATERPSGGSDHG